MSEITVPHVEAPYPFEAYAHVVEPLTEGDGGGYLIKATGRETHERLPDHVLYPAGQTPPWQAPGRLAGASVP